MAYLDNSTKNIQVVLSNLGKNIIASRPHEFKIDRYSFDDQEIDYTLSVSSITTTLISQGSASVNTLQNNVRSLPEGSQYVYDLELSNDEIVIDSTNGIDNCVISTVEFTEELGYTVYCSSKNILLKGKDEITNPTKALTVSNNIVAVLNNTDVHNANNYINITKTINSQSIRCKTTFEIQTLGVIGIYYITVIGNNSLAVANLKVIVKL